tara:strand:- start:122 stop:979 length:858 start_codon:yes stop_codon:yes gene_type:complete
MSIFNNFEKKLTSMKIIITKINLNICKFINIEMKAVNLFYRLLSRFNKFFGYKESFSGDGEDSILNKYLLDLKEGNYIDIGSHHPVTLSNTFSFYLKNWKGICLDPLPLLKKKYELYRPSDLFINSGIISKQESNGKKLKYYYYKKHPDCSTFDPDRVEKLRINFNRKPTSIKEVSTITVDDLIKIADKFYNESYEIHLLNIDTEGFELDICKDFFLIQKYPWIISVEEIGYTAENINLSDINKLMKENNYILGARTFLSSIYIRKDKISKLPSPFLKELYKIKT